MTSQNKLRVAVSILAVGASFASARASEVGSCQKMQMPDKSEVTMCQDENGNWRQAATTAPQGSIGGSSGPEHVSARYNGRFAIEVIIPPRMNARDFNPTNFNVGNLITKAMDVRTRKASGTIGVVAEIVGSRVTADVTGRGITPFKASGTRRGGVCHLTSTISETKLDGPCGPDGFAGSLSGRTLEGQKFSGQFEAAAVEFVDVEKRERERIAAEEAEKKRVAEQEAAYRALPDAGPARTKLLDQLVATDSKGWAQNRYDAGSVTNVKIISGDPKTGSYAMRGDYSFNGGSKGFVTAQFQGDKFDCIEFWDSIVGCRPLRKPGEGQEIASGLIGALLGGSGSTGGGGGGDEDDGGYGDLVHDRERRSQESAPPPPPPPVEPIGGDSGFYGSDHSCC